MSDKRRRLVELSRHSNQTPQTYWGHEEFAAAHTLPSSRWWVRSLADEPLERYRHSQGPWSPNQVESYFSGLDTRTQKAALFVIQQYVEPKLAGVSLCSAEFVLSEGIEGSASPLLRGGECGDMIASIEERVSWRLSRVSLDAAQADCLERAHASIPLGGDALWEWIVSASGSIYHVDRKPLPTPFLATLPSDGPPRYWRLGSETEGDTSIALPDTSIEHLQALGQARLLRIATGSPMAHLCFEAVCRGHVIALDVRPPL